MLDVRRLMLLRELAVRGSMAAVAEAMQYSPSAVSQQLAVLEREAGLPLLRKAGRGVQLTPQAEVLVAAAEEIADVLERLDTDLAALGDVVRGRVRVAVFQSAALALMPAALRAMRDAHPDVRIEMVQKEPEEALRDTWARDFDVVIAEQYPEHSAAWLRGLRRQQLTTDEVRLAVPPGSSAEGIDDVRDAVWFMEPRGTASRHFAEQLCRTHGFEPDVRYESADLQSQIRLVESGNAVGLMPDLMWTGRETTCRLLPLPGRPRRTVFTARRAASASSPAMTAFLAALERSAAEQAAAAG